MGDVGSLAIGGALGTVAILTKQEFLLPFIGGVFILEAAFGDAAGFVFQVYKAEHGHRKAYFPTGAASSSFSDVRLERAEDSFSFCDCRGTFRVVESFDFEIALKV